MKKPQVSVVIPAFNESEFITKMIKAVIKLLNSSVKSWEIIVVENGSTDDTAQKVLDLQKEYKQLILLKLPSAGYGRALIKGLKAAQGEFTVVFSVDLWDKKFVNLCTVDLLGYDLISSSKLLPFAQDRRPLSRRLISLIYNLLLKCFGFKGTDTHGIKAFRTEKIKPIISKCRTTSGIFDSELIIKAQRANLPYLELPIEVREIRPSRFKMNRFFQTPLDIWHLYQSLS